MEYPSLKARKLWSILAKKPMEYRVARQAGSHRTLVSRTGYPTLHLSFHDKQTIPRGLVRKILVDDVGLTDEQVRDLL